MATTYADLVTKIRNYTEVDDTVFTSAIINGFIFELNFFLLSKSPEFASIT